MKSLPNWTRQSLKASPVLIYSLIKQDDYGANTAIGDSPQGTPVQAHLTPKKEGTSPLDLINSKVSLIYIASIDAKSSNYVLNTLSLSELNNHCNSTSYNLLRDHVTIDTAKSKVISCHDPKWPDSISENITMLTTNSIQAINCSAIVEEDLIIVLAKC
ncbi:LOW QUALITY PROTEIN: hypothetical protein IFM46972_11437 [Aspergillus udagawae]|uniref:Uncharacterized protein n=1 Tax=Aspergillus udagawae TaxID=91492 RepID=A0A8H3SGC4_9EURO|nr:LOW QUALITY PROTEIN: hypothetical protein IFM46972_11437 [Aspergillus udagawae]